MTKKIDQEQLILLAKVHCTLVEMAATLDCHVDTIENRIKEYFDMTPGEFIKKYQAAGRASLRKRGYTRALQNDDMLKFHLKNLVGMSEKTESIHKNPDGTSINTSPTVIILPAKVPVSSKPE